MLLFVALFPSPLFGAGGTKFASSLDMREIEAILGTKSRMEMKGFANFGGMK